MLDEDSDIVWQETFKDFATDNMHRSDIYVRGPVHLTPKEQHELLDNLSISLVYSPKSGPESLSSPVGKVVLRPDARAQVVAALAEGIRTIGLLASQLGDTETAFSAVLDFVRIMVAHGCFHPMPTRSGGFATRSEI